MNSGAGILACHASRYSSTRSIGRSARGVPLTVAGKNARPTEELPMKRISTYIALLFILCCPIVRGAFPTTTLSDGRLGYGYEGLPIPPVLLKDETSPRTVELLGAALSESQRTTAQRIQLVFDL